MSNNSRTVLYIGVTNDLYRRYVEHRDGIIEGFTQKYKCHSLVYYEEFARIEEAISREKELKGWSRMKKEMLIKKINPSLKDLAEELEWV